MIEIKASHDYEAKENSIINNININDYIKSKTIKSAWINIGGWQSWNPGMEIAPNKKQPSLKCHLINQWNSYLVFPESKFKESKNLVLGQFITYLRWEDTYLFVISTGNIKNTLPPVQFVFNRRNNSIIVEIADKGKLWKKDELQAQIEVFVAFSYFEAKEKLKYIFGINDKSSPLYNNKFDQIQFLGKHPLGWESWYNHYANIDEKLIIDDLESLNSNKSFISKIKEDSKAIFQIDDGWEKELGNWEIDTAKFPNGLKTITEKIESYNYIPGLWIAPFIIDSRTDLAKNHPEWLLKNNKGKNIPAGYNPLWGKNGTFYCLDLSNQDVINHLDNVIDTAINKWGFRYLKLDFLYAGMLYGDFVNSGASYQWYKKAIDKLTARKQNNKGEPVTYLGCGLPLELSFNNFPLSRIGCDTYENWENKPLKLINWNGRNSAYLNLQDTLGHSITDKIVYANDPDVLFIRNENCSLTKDEKILIATVNLIFGSQIMYSDDPAKSVSEEEIKLMDEIIQIKKRLENEEFSIKKITNTSFEINSQSKTYKGIIDLGKKHFIKIENNNN